MRAPHPKTPVGGQTGLGKTLKGIPIQSKSTEVDVSAPAMAGGATAPESMDVVTVDAAFRAAIRDKGVFKAAIP